MPENNELKIPDAPEENRLEKILKERFGDAKLGSIMDRIVGEMFKSVDEKPDPKQD